MRRIRPAGHRSFALTASAVLLLALSAVPATAADPSPPAASTDSGGSVPAGNLCPQVLDASSADFYPVQPSFSAGYTLAGQKLNDDTADWAYVISGEFPYSYWMSWYLYNTKGQPLFKLSDQDIIPEPGSTNPFVSGQPILAPERNYKITVMPNDTPDSVITAMQEAGENVAVLPEIGSTKGTSFVFRSYWSLSNDDLGDWDRFGYGGPTDSPVHTIAAFLTDPDTGEITDTPVDDCASQSQVPKRIAYDPVTGKPVLTFVKAPRPTSDDLANVPRFKLQTGSVAGFLGGEFAPAPVPEQVQFYRNVAANSPYADVAAAPPTSDPPDACGGYVMANLPNDVVSMVHIPQVPTFPDYRGATASTVNDSDQYDLRFYSVVVYGATKQLDALGTVKNTQIGNRQIEPNADGSATIVLYPQSATSQQVEKIDAVVKANGWNILRSGVQNNKAPNLLVVREKGPNDTWPDSLSPNSVTAGAPCPQSTDPTLPLPQDPPSAQVTQFNGMGLAAPQGQNCSIESFLSGQCLQALSDQLSSTGAVWSATYDTAPEQVQP